MLAGGGVWLLRVCGGSGRSMHGGAGLGSAEARVLGFLGFGLGPFKCFGFGPLVFWALPINLVVYWLVSCHLFLVWFSDGFFCRYALDSFNMCILGWFNLCILSQ